MLACRTSKLNHLKNLKFFNKKIFLYVSISSKRSFVPIREGETTIFYVNTGGFPLQDETCMKMYEFAKELQPQGIFNIINIKKLY